MSITTAARRGERLRTGTGRLGRASKHQPTRSSARQPRALRTRTIRRDAGLHIPPATDRRQDIALTLLSVAVGPVLLVSGAAILGVPVGSLISAEAPSVVHQHLPRLDAGLREAERLMGLGAAGLGILLSLASLLATLASLILVVLLRLGRLETGPTRDLLERLSPEFMRRTVVLALTAQLAVGGAAAATGLHQHTPANSTPTETSPGISVTALTEERSSATGPDDALFRAVATEEVTDHTAQTWSPEVSGYDTTEKKEPQPLEKEPMSPLFTPETPDSDVERHQGSETRDRIEADITVRAGDTLWDIAAEQLGPHATDWEIAELWPQWYEANQQVIGDDPGHLLPGTVLTAPDEGKNP
ncbi:LysM peptidoglycan-binding domain-containing protein [Nesterenkonia suensis]